MGGDALTGNARLPGHRRYRRADQRLPDRLYAGAGPPGDARHDVPSGRFAAYPHRRPLDCHRHEHAGRFDRHRHVQPRLPRAWPSPFRSRTAQSGAGLGRGADRARHPHLVLPGIYPLRPDDVCGRLERAGCGARWARPVNAYKIWAYIISGVFASIGGILLAARLGRGRLSHRATIFCWIPSPPP